MTNTMTKVLKEHKEFYTIDTSKGWVKVPGYPEGIDHQILAGWLDEEKRTGTRTRLLRFAPGAFTTKPFEHEYWEEVFQISGDLTVGGVTYAPFTYAVRPPHVKHGPFSSKNGCLLLEIHFFDPKYTV